jgi:hypothetical protein
MASEVQSTVHPPGPNNIFSMSLTTRQYEDFMLKEHYFSQNVHFINYVHTPLTLLTMQASNTAINKLKTSLKLTTTDTSLQQSAKPNPFSLPPQL